jgi:hypothetical protein
MAKLGLAAVISANLAIFLLLFWFLGFLRENSQPATEGTVILARMSYLWIVIGLAVPFAGASHPRAAWLLSIAVCVLLLASLCLVLFLQWFMVSVKG